MPDRAKIALGDEALRRALDAAPDGIVIVDDDGMIVFVNPMMSTMFGYTSAELVGTNVDALLPEDLRAHHQDLRDGYTKNPHSRQMGSGLELRGRHKTGDVFPVEIGLSPMQGALNDFVVAVVRDVTERRRVAMELRQAQEEVALLDDRERIARDLHDTVIQRLFAIGLSLQGALNASVDSKTTNRVEAAIDEIDGTIRDIRAAIFSLHARRLPTAGPRDDVIATAREAAGGLGFEPHVIFDGLVDTMMTEAARAQLVPTLREALSNITKHAHACRVEVVVAVEGNELRVRVSDDGVGIADTAHGGLGIANITERAVALNGTCTVSSPPSGGTVVDWRVPLQ